MFETPPTQSDGPRACHLCAQIAGRSEEDLLQQTVGGPEYVRRVVLETPELAVIPSLGPLVDGHVLVVPKIHARSFAQLQIEPAIVEAFLSRAKTTIANAFGSRVQVFEHGTGANSAQPACSVEHAHVHIVPCAVEFDDPPVAGYEWETMRNEAALRELVGDGEYLRVGTASGWSIARGAEGFPSQLLRRVLSEAIEAEEATDWDWRANPRPDSVRRTFSRLSVTAS